VIAIKIADGGADGGSDLMIQFYFLKPRVGRAGRVGAIAIFFSHQIYFLQGRARQSRSEQGRAGRAGQSGQSRSERRRAGRAGQSKWQNGRANGRAAQSGAEQRRAAQSRSEQVRAAQSGAEQRRAGQSSAERGRAPLPENQKKIEAQIAMFLGTQPAVIVFQPSAFKPNKMSAAIESRSDLRAAISEMKSALARMEMSLGESPMSAQKGKKAKKERDPDAPKKPANKWIQFTSRVNTILKAAAQDAKDAGDEALLKTFSGPATIGKQFCSFLKEQKSYDEWDDAEILEAFNGWERPAPKEKSESASETGSVTESSTEKKERKKRAPMSDEAKATMATKRAATIAAKTAAAATEQPAAVIAAVTEQPAPVKKMTKKVVKNERVYTRDEIEDFSETITVDGTEYGRNVRGDVIDEDGEFVGHWDAKAKKLDRSVPKPDDIN